MTAVLAPPTTTGPAAPVRRRLRDDELQLLPSLLRIPLSWVEPGPNRRGADVGDVSDLAVSMSSLGQMMPVLVEQLGERRFRLIEGHRRRKAAQLAGLTHLDAVLRGHLGDADRTLRQLAIQTHAKAFEPIAEARALHDLMWTYGMSREEIGRKLGRTPTWVRDRIALLQLTEQEQEQVEQRILPLGDALARVRVRRDTRDGRAPAGPRAARASRDEHFVDAHPLAPAARARCRDAGHTRTERFVLGGVACGDCWEQTIRDDERSCGGAR